MTPLEQIGQGIQKLREFVRRHQARFELADENSPNRREFERLNWLADSLYNFLTRGARLHFVGFLGHFNSGKSRTINSLMEHLAPGEATPMGLHHFRPIKTYRDSMVTHHNYKNF